jgi:dolichyl-diphosphooligosaccharide--protein glycosyltransferase
VVSFELMRLGLWVTRYGSWDFNKKEGAGALMSNLTPALKFSMKDGQIQAKDGQVVYADSIDVFSPAGLERGAYKNGSGYHFVFNPAPAGQAEQVEKRADALARFWRWQRGNFSYTAITNDKMALDDAYYNSLMVQLLLCQRNDPRISPYFRLVYDNIYTRVYEVR